MEEEIKQRLSNRNVWMRGLYMLLFLIAYSVAELVIGVVAIFQFVVVLFTGRANKNALELGNNLSTYVYQVFRFQTFNTETKPYPFSDWPREAVEENVWIDGEGMDDVDVEDSATQPADPEGDRRDSIG